MNRRYLSLLEIRLALESGRAVENWLGFLIRDENRLIRWVRIHQETTDEYGVTIVTNYDQGTEAATNVNDFQPYYPDEPFGLMTVFSDLERAFDYATIDLGATPDRFVNDGVIENEYRDFLKAHGVWTYPGGHCQPKDPEAQKD